MAHIHIPDGVLPYWLWAAGVALLLPFLTLAILKVRKEQKRSVIAAAMTAFMLLIFSIGIFEFHLNMTPLAGMVLGPYWSLLSVTVLNLFLSLTGHGGVTIIGLNALINWFEALVGWYGFGLARKAFKDETKLSLSAGLVTFTALLLSFGLFIGVVYSSNINPGLFDHHHAEEEHHEEEHHEEIHHHAPIDMRTFVSISAVMTLIGSVIEAIIATLMVGYIIKVKPEILYGI